MKKCSDDPNACSPLCDFCRHYDFNGEMETDEDGQKYNVYVGNGWCRLHNEQRDPEEECEDFHCFNEGKPT